jgi:hypothetical protein
MSFHPDYGLALLRSGVNRDFQSYFYALHLDHITAVGPNQFTTLFNVMYDGKEHALSLDFGADELNDILDFAEPATASEIRGWVQRLRGVDTLNLPKRVTFGARASLGEEQRAEKERYVPLIVQEVFPAQTL